MRCRQPLSSHICFVCVETMIIGATASAVVLYQRQSSDRKVGANY